MRKLVGSSSERYFARVDTVTKHEPGASATETSGSRAVREVIRNSPSFDHRPFSSTCSTSEAVAAWIGRSAERAGPTPTPVNGTEGDPEDEPALTTRLETVNGSRFSTLRVVLPRVRRAGLTVTKAEATERSTTLLNVAPSSTETDELSRNETLPSGSQAWPCEHELATTSAPGLADFGIGEHDVQKQGGGDGQSEAHGIQRPEAAGPGYEDPRARLASRLASAASEPWPRTWTNTRECERVAGSTSSLEVGGRRAPRRIAPPGRSHERS